MPKKVYKEMVFTLTPKQVEKYEKWLEKKNKKSGEVYVGAIGGAYSFVFIPTGLGTIEKVVCTDGSELDLTDSDSW